VAARQDTDPPPRLHACDDRDRDLAAVTEEFPEWETWGGPIAGLLYAKRRNPQIVVRATSTESLRDEIEKAERKRGLR
jgi:hypothetical protein